MTLRGAASTPTAASRGGVPRTMVFPGGSQTLVARRIRGDGLREQQAPVRRRRLIGLATALATVPMAMTAAVALRRVRDARGRMSATGLQSTVLPAPGLGV